MIIMSDLARQSVKVYQHLPLRIVLVEPAGGLNVGSIARVMKNMGLFHLTLVKPKCDPLGEDARQMAVHADDILTTATVVETVPDALKGCQRVVATTARDRDLNLPVNVPTEGLRWLLDVETTETSDGSNAIDSTPAALLFGPEDRGLSNAELIYAQRLINIPTNPAYASLNLAQAVTICCYELRQLMSPQLFQSSSASQVTPQADRETLPSPPRGPRDVGAEGPQAEDSKSVDIAPFEALEGYYQQLEDVLLRIGYLYPHTAKRRMEKFRLLFNRSKLSSNEVAMLRGILRQIEWAIQSDSPDLHE